MNLKNLNYKKIFSTIEIVNIKKKIIYKKNQSILFFLIKNNIDIAYECQSGYCGTCRVELIQGNIFYSNKEPIAALLTSKDIFPCCCQADGNIIIKI